MSDWLFAGAFPDVVHCRGCPWEGSWSDLVRGEEAEIMHPQNKNGIVHLTKYEACPRCGRWLFADGQPVGGETGGKL